MAHIYGSKGNRWWVGLNTAVNNKTILGTGSVTGGGNSNPLNPTPSGYESLPSGNAVDDAKFAAAAIADKISPVTISVENVNWYNINGPYPTQAAANAAIPAIQKAHPAPGVLQSAANALGAGGLLSWEQSVGNFFGDLGQASTWVRVGEVVLGVILIAVGVAKLTNAVPIATAIAKKVP